jgi:hypothetical protein
MNDITGWPNAEYREKIRRDMEKFPRAALTWTPAQRVALSFTVTRPCKAPGPLEPSWPQ